MPLVILFLFLLLIPLGGSKAETPFSISGTIPASSANATTNAIGISPIIVGITNKIIYISSSGSSGGGDVFSAPNNTYSAGTLQAFDAITVNGSGVHTNFDKIIFVNNQQYSTAQSAYNAATALGVPVTMIVGIGTSTNFGGISVSGASWDSNVSVAGFGKDVSILGALDFQGASSLHADNVAFTSVTFTADGQAYFYGSGTDLGSIATGNNEVQIYIGKTLCTKSINLGNTSGNCGSVTVDDNVLIDGNITGVTTFTTGPITFGQNDRMNGNISISTDTPLPGGSITLNSGTSVTGSVASVNTDSGDPRAAGGNVTLNNASCGSINLTGGGGGNPNGNVTFFDSQCGLVQNVLSVTIKSRNGQYTNTVPAFSGTFVLSGSTTNTGLIATSGNILGNTVSGVTNTATVYRQNGVTGFSGVVTNAGVALNSTNILFYGSGILTNMTRVP